MVAHAVLRPESIRDVLLGCPRYAGAGYFPYHRTDCGAGFNRLIDELRAPAFADAVGERLGVDQLSRFPLLIEVCNALNRRHGVIHTDSASKVVTALLYLNPEWPADEHGGCLRFLSCESDIESTLVPEIPPLYGTLAAFRRCDNSFHGHLPFEGKRQVIQMAWLTDHHALRHKTKLGNFSRFIKWLSLGMDRHIGHGKAP